MKQTWQTIDFVPYLQYRWRLPAIACASALCLSLFISSLLPKQYTARVTISIDPPGGNDVRIATAVSPVYLESLKGYEHLVAGDSLFAKAVERFQLSAANPSEPIETLKRRVLKIAKIRETRILQVDVTLPDPRMAHNFAEYIAQQAVAQNDAERIAGDRDREAKLTHELGEARERLDLAARRGAGDASDNAVETLESRSQADVDLMAELRRESNDAVADEAELAGQAGKSQLLENARARAGVLRASVASLDREISANGSQLNRANARRDAAENELTLAQSEYISISSRLRDFEAASGNGGEKLRILDPGIVPQRPSSPNLLLNVVAATFIAALASAVYLALSFSYERRRVRDVVFQ